jgi:hypothetical protein
MVPSQGRSWELAGNFPHRFVLSSRSSRQVFVVDRYRRLVMDRVQEAATNWGLALIRVDLDRRLTKENRSIEQMLGQLVLDSLFGIMGAAVTAVVHHGIEKHLTPHEASGNAELLEAREEAYLDKPPSANPSRSSRPMLISWPVEPSRIA